MNDIMKPEDCTFLQKRLGRRFDRVSSAYNGKGSYDGILDDRGHKRGRKPTTLMNPTHWYFTTLDTPIWENIDSAIEDCIMGICKLDHSQASDNNNQLSAGKCVALLRRKSLTTDTIERVIKVDKRQAQRYMKALKIMVPFIERNLRMKMDRDTIRYRKQVIDDCEFWEIDYDDDYLDQTVESIFTVLYTPDGISPDYGPYDE